MEKKNWQLENICVYHTRFFLYKALIFLSIFYFALEGIEKPAKHLITKRIDIGSSIKTSV